jgi:putative phosphoesterase
MLIGIVSDVHGNTAALRHALDAFSESVDEVLVAGDAFSDHLFSNDVVAMIRESGARYILGNHEMSFLGPASAAARGSRRVDQDHLAFVAERPLEARTSFGGRQLLMVHGSPWQPYGDYLHPSSPKFSRCDELGADFLVLGHTHTAFQKRFGRTLVVNPGSLGRSDDPTCRDDVTYAVLDTDSGEAELFRFPNPLLTPQTVPIP